MQFSVWPRLTATDADRARFYSAEMKDLTDRLDEINGFHLFGLEEAQLVNSVMASDIRLHVHQGACSTPLFKLLFSEAERAQSSAMRELAALCYAYVVKQFSKKFEGEKILSTRQR